MLNVNPSLEADILIDRRYEAFLWVIGSHQKGTFNLFWVTDRQTDLLLIKVCDKGILK